MSAYLRCGYPLTRTSYPRVWPYLKVYECRKYECHLSSIRQSALECCLINEAPSYYHTGIFHANARQGKTKAGKSQVKTFSTAKCKQILKIPRTTEPLLHFWCPRQTIAYFTSGAFAHSINYRQISSHPPKQRSARETQLNEFLIGPEWHQPL